MKLQWSTVRSSCRTNQEQDSDRGKVDDPLSDLHHDGLERRKQGENRLSLFADDGDGKADDLRKSKRSDKLGRFSSGDR